jgi:hypothetical protein
VRVLLDVHVSSRHVGRPLEAAGHDVLALDQDEQLRRLTDEEILERATVERRVVVTHNHRHYAPILRRWGEAGQDHAGCVLVTVPQSAYGVILRGLEHAFATRPTQDEWVNRAEFLAHRER